MKATELETGLGFPEGPVVLDDGALVFCDGNTGDLLRFDGAAVAPFSHTGGSPWGAVLGNDRALYVTQGGPVPGSGESATSGIQRVSLEGDVELLCSEVDGRQLFGPNDLAFGPDGRLYFTESGSEDDDRFDVRSPGRLFSLESRSSGAMVLELPGVYPNGIAFDREGRLYWTESKSRRVRRLDNGSPTVVAQLPESHVPDGMAFAGDGRMFVATTTSGGVTVLSPDGKIVGEIELGEHPTNCAFSGSALYVTATKIADIEASQRTGSLWRVETDAVGLPLGRGRVT